MNETLMERIEHVRGNASSSSRRKAASTS
jgi:hypothetical protein